MRLATAGIHHESNTFAADQAELALFEQGGIHRGNEIRMQYGESHSTMAGFLEVEKEPGVTLEPILMGNVNPSGPLTGSAYQTLSEEILDALDRSGPWDGVLLAQHGAAVADGTPDLDGDFTARVRQVVGDSVSIGVAVDMHANVSSLLFSSCDVLVAYQTNPHVDPRPRARHCADLIRSTITGETRPASALVQVPIALHIAVQDTDQAPMSELLELTRSVESGMGLASASLVEGFPYADVPQMGMAVVTVSDGNVDVAAEAAIRIASAIWERRAELTTTLPSPARALEEAAATPSPTLVLDVGDNIGGGSPGDSTVLLHQARKLGISGLFQTLCDPEAVSQCSQKTKLNIEVGGKRPGTPAPPFPLDGRVTATTDGRYEDPTPTHGGFRYFDAGPCAVVSTDEDNTILLTSRLVPNTSLQQLRHAGLDPASFSVLVAKGVNAPKAAYREVVDGMVYADTPGVTSADLGYFKYHNRSSCYPFEDWDWIPLPITRLAGE